MSHRQSGLTLISLAALLGILAFFVMLVIVLFPIYNENFKVRSHLNTLKADTSFTTMDDGELLDKLFNSFRVDDVENVHQEDVTIERSDSNLTVTVNYEVRAHTVGNVDVVVSFANSVSANL